MNWWQQPAQTVNTELADAARARQLSLTKPPGSLGQLEELAVAFAGWQGRVDPQVNAIAMRIFAADHGVVAEGVSAFPQAVTVEMQRNFAAGGAAISVLARHMNADFSVVNMGSASEEKIEGVDQVDLGPGTENFCQGMAMREEQLAAALQAGADRVPVNADVFIGGEMGIGNTTAAAALTAALLNVPAADVVGRGTGVDDEGLLRKRTVVDRALDYHAAELDKPLTLLQVLGGFEIAALTGAYIRSAQHGIPSVVDGYICTAAAAIAVALNPSVREWLIFAHCSAEPGHRLLLESLEAEPLLDFGMRLGEGSGAALVVPLLQSACRLHSEMATFAEAGVSDKD